MPSALPLLLRLRLAAPLLAALLPVRLGHRAPLLALPRFAALLACFVTPLIAPRLRTTLLPWLLPLRLLTPLEALLDLPALLLGTLLLDLPLLALEARLLPLLPLAQVAALMQYLAARLRLTLPAEITRGTLVAIIAAI